MKVGLSATRTAARSGLSVGRTAPASGMPVLQEKPHRGSRSGRRTARAGAVAPNPTDTNLAAWTSWLPS